MAIKPKSRAHEDRIKSLEKQQDQTRQLLDDYLASQDCVEVAPGQFLVKPRKSAYDLGQIARQPWYKRIFGL